MASYRSIGHVKKLNPLVRAVNQPADQNAVTPAGISADRSRAITATQVSDFQKIKRQSVHPQFPHQTAYGFGHGELRDVDLTARKADNR